MVGEMNLVDHGIQNEDSDFRVHICFTAKQAYVFQTAQAAGVMKSYRIVEAFQWVNGKKMVTSRGHIVPPGAIPGCEWIAIPHDIILGAAMPSRSSNDTSQKGRAAESITQAMLSRGLLPLPQLTEIVSNKDLQISGLDIMLKPVKIQIKCDYRGGHKEFGGTGNLYLEVAERNPHKKF